MNFKYFNQQWLKVSPPSLWALWVRAGICSRSGDQVIEVWHHILHTTMEQGKIQEALDIFSDKLMTFTANYFENLDDSNDLRIIHLKKYRDYKERY